MENSAPSLKIFRTKFSTSALCNGRNKNRRQNPVWEFTKTIIPFALVGYEVIMTNSRYALVGYFITSYPTRAHGIIVIYIPPPSSLPAREASSENSNTIMSRACWSCSKLKQNMVFSFTTEWRKAKISLYMESISRITTADPRDNDSGSSPQR